MTLVILACGVSEAAPGGLGQLQEAEKNTPPEPKKPKTKPRTSRAFVKTWEQLQADFQKIRQKEIQYSGSLSSVPSNVSMFLPTPGSSTKPNDELKTLMRYRAVVGLPFEDLELDRAFTLHAAAAAYLLNTHGSLSHNPPCPEEDFSPDLYRFAIQGTSHSNIFWGDSGMTGCVRSFMKDSDPTNIVHMGHRRWCLNPSMKKTGFGEFGKFAAMWAFDTSRPLPDYDFIPFPARGLTPVNLLDATWAWSVTLNPKKYKLTSDVDKVTIHVTPTRFDTQKKTFTILPGELTVKDIHVSQMGFGVPLCVIFRPEGYECKPDTAYCVEIIGFSNTAGEPTLIQYWVVFCQPMN